MKRFLTISITFLFGLSLFSFAYAQNEQQSLPIGSSTTPTLGIEDAYKFRQDLIDLFGLPDDTPFSIFDLIQGGGGEGGQIGGTPLPGTPLLDLKIVADTQTFNPGREVEVVAAALSENMQLVNIEWYHNGVKRSSGVGQTVYRFTLGPIGTSEVIRVVATTRDGKHSNEISRTFYPARVHFTWFADSKTPAWYRGKGLASPGSITTVVAVPEYKIGSQTLDPSTLIYEWNIQDNGFNQDPKISGVGKNSFEFQLTNVVSFKNKLTVRVSDASKRIVHQETINLASHIPEVLFYELDSLVGLKTWKELLKAILLSGDTVAIQAEPFFIPTTDAADIDYSWRVNNKSVENRDPKNRVFRLATDEGVTGLQKIAVRYRNIKKILQQGVGEMSVSIIEP